MNQQGKLASLSVWMVGTIVFALLTLATIAILRSQSSNANSLSGQPLVDEGQPQVKGEQLSEEVTIAALPGCPSAAPCMFKEFIPNEINHGETSVLSITIVPSGVLTDFTDKIEFTDVLTTGLVLASAPTDPGRPFCNNNAEIEGVAGSSVFTVTRARLLLDYPVCTITVTVGAAGPGTYVNSVDNITNARTVDTSTAYAELQVIPAPLIIRADDKQMWRGSNPPPLTASYFGLVYPDVPAGLDDPVVLTTTADNYSPVGMYPITASGASDPFYEITPVDGIMTVYVNRFIEKKGMPVYPPWGFRIQ